MSTLSQFLKYSAVASFISSPLVASDGFYLLSDHPDEPMCHVKYATEPQNLHLNDAGYLKAGPDTHVLGWPLHYGMYPDFMNWEINLGVVKVRGCHESTMPTSAVTTSFSLPTGDVIGTEYTHTWHIYDYDGQQKDVVGHLRKSADVSWDLYFTSPDASAIHHGYFGGPIIDNVNAYIMTFNPDGTLLDIMAPSGEAAMPVNVCLSWMMADGMPGMDQIVMFDFGPAGMPAEDPMATVLGAGEFLVKQSMQNGFGPREMTGSHVDAAGVLHTDYADGSSAPSYQIARLRLGMYGSNGLEPAEYDDAELAVINTVIQG